MILQRVSGGIDWILPGTGTCYAWWCRISACCIPTFRRKGNNCIAPCRGAFGAFCHAAHFRNHRLHAIVSTRSAGPYSSSTQGNRLGKIPYGLRGRDLGGKLRGLWACTPSSQYGNFYARGSQYTTGNIQAHIPFPRVRRLQYDRINSHHEKITRNVIFTYGKLGLCFFQ